MNHNPFILVVGDLMLDRWVEGIVSRMSPEAACPVFVPTIYEWIAPGGAANVARILSDTGFSVAIGGVIACDEDGVMLTQLLHKAGVDTSATCRQGELTTSKKRYITPDRRHIMRLDRDCLTQLPDRMVDILIDKMRSGATALVISDYSKGAITPDCADRLLTEAARMGIPSIVDIKENAVEKFRAGATIIKGNAKEFSQLTGCPVTDSATARTALTQAATMLRSVYIVMTRGKEGMLALRCSDGEIIEVPAFTAQGSDPTGAGDIVTAFLAFHSVGNEFDMQRAMREAAKAAAMKMGMHPAHAISIRDIEKPSKLITAAELPKVRRGKRIVFTNGCFDLLHAGHVHLLEKAREMGDMLIVGVNTDSSVARLKGPSRPVNTLERRVKVLSALECVDYIVAFDEDTPINLIRTLCPDVLVKGSDYTPESVVGADFVKAHGGKVAIIDLIPGLSTTSLLNTLRQ